MPRMKLLSSLSFDQIGHAPGRPQPSAITQRFGTFFQSAAQLLQLRGQQSGFATGPARLEKSLGPLFSPGLVPSTDRLTVNPQLPRHLALTVAAIKELGRFESSPFQVLEIPLNAFWVAHTPKTTTQAPACHYIMRINSKWKVALFRLAHYDRLFSWKSRCLFR